MAFRRGVLVIPPDDTPPGHSDGAREDEEILS